MEDLIKALKEISERDAIYGVERLVKQAQKLFPDARNLRQAATEALNTSSKNRSFPSPRIRREGSPPHFVTKFGKLMLQIYRHISKH